MRLKTRRGDSIIEVMFAITVFCLVSIISINLMNNGVSTAQSTLELTMARNEIDAQAEALRFIQNSALAERELAEENQEYVKLWRQITTNPDDKSTFDHGYAINASELASFSINTCDEAYDTSNKDNIYMDHAFVINTRSLQPNDLTAIIRSSVGSDTFGPTPLYPRLVFTSIGGANTSDDDLIEDYSVLRHAEGIWVIAVKSDSKHPTTKEPEFFDFHIRACWYAPGRGNPTTIGTIVRLYNPEVVQ